MTSVRYARGALRVPRRDRVPFSTFDNQRVIRAHTAPAWFDRTAYRDNGKVAAAHKEIPEDSAVQAGSAGNDGQYRRCGP